MGGSYLPAPRSGFTLPPSEAASVASGDFAPETVVWAKDSRIGYSLDGGRHWHATASLPASAPGGPLAVSSNGKTWVWGGFWSDDLGAIWTPSQKLPSGLRVVADRTSAERFYAMDAAGEKLYVSSDGGKRFAERELGLPEGSRRAEGFYPTPGRAGDLWVAASDGLYHASPARPFAKLAGVSEARALGFGKAAPGRVGPTLFLAGSVGGVRGVFRSDDGATTWSRIDEGLTGSVVELTGDLRRFGRVVVATSDRGAFLGEPR